MQPSSQRKCRPVIIRTGYAQVEAASLHLSLDFPDEAQQSLCRHQNPIFCVYNSMLTSATCLSVPGVVGKGKFALSLIRGSRPSRVWKFSSSPPCSDRLWSPPQPPIQWVPGALFLEVKRPKRDADHSPPSSAEVKNKWSYTSTPPVRLHGVVLS
jgi:hypothetical protein